MILAAGLTPVLQQVLTFDAVVPGAVNRARASAWCASGKVLNAARALHHLGADARALTVVGGATGAAVRRDCERLGVAGRWIDTATPTRVCTTVLETEARTATELVTDAEPLGDTERAAFRAAYAEEAARAGVVILIGSLPAGTPASFYRELLANTPGRAVLDARGPELLEALAARPFLVKPNREELARTLGRDLRDDAALIGALGEVTDRGAAWVVITDGPRPVHAASAGHVYRLRPPPAAVVNPIGCGDCLAAGIAWALDRGREPLDAVRHGVAVAADKLGRPLPGMVDRARAEALAEAVRVDPL